MVDTDLEEFQGMLDAVCSLISRGTHMPNEADSAMWFRALGAYDLSVVRRGLDGHVKDPQRGKFVPTPADIIAQIERLCFDGRPGVEEAWAMVPQSETETVVWTAEMAEAYNACAPLLNAGDRIAARMTFREVYARELARAKAIGAPVTWIPCLGSDKVHRERVLGDAVKTGRITVQAFNDACPRIGDSLAPLLLAAPESKKGRVQQIQSSLDAMVEGWRGESAKPKAWVQALLDREARGEALTMGQRDMLRDATLYESKTGAPSLSDFRPIPLDVLPPNMRAAIERERSQAGQQREHRYRKGREGAGPLPSIPDEAIVHSARRVAVNDQVAPPDDEQHAA